MKKLVMHCFLYKIYPHSCFCLVLLLVFSDPNVKVARRVKFGVNKGLGVKTHH